MDDLAALGDITGPAVLNSLTERFIQGKHYTYCGDFLVFANPHEAVGENESELGKMHRSAKPLKELPPHAIALAHRVYRMLMNDVTAQAIVITGRSGSGKTETARRVISQFLREARLSPLSGLGPRIVMAQHVLNALVSAQTRYTASSTRTIKMTTLQFRPDGQIVSAELQAVCSDKWYLTDRGPGCGTFNIFYALLAGMNDQEFRLYHLTDQYRLLGRGDSSPLFLTREDHGQHARTFDFFMNCLASLGIDEQCRNYAGYATSAILSVLAAILHLSNLDLTTHPQSGQAAIANPQELQIASDLLAVNPEYLQAELLTTTTIINGETVRAPCSPQQAGWNKDVLLVELYRRLVSVVIARLNRALCPDTRYTYMDQGQVTPVSVVESPAPQADLATGGLEAFFRNMAAERIQHHLYEVIFKRDVDTCERERVQAYKIKYADNIGLISAVFGLDFGILNKLTMVSMDAQGSPEGLVSLMNNDRSLKKTGCYVKPAKSAKTPDVFLIQHTGLGQVTYSAADFISKNRSSLPETMRQLLAHSGNPLVPALASVQAQETGFQQDMMAPGVLLASRTFHSDLTYVIQTLDNANLHHIRCLKSNSNSSPGHFDPALVTDQLKECCMVETARQRKFGYSACIPQEHFAKSFRELAYGPFSKTPTVPKACKEILDKAGLLGRGVKITKTSLLLSYWQVQRLHALKAEEMRRTVVVQAHVRGFLVRRRMRGFLRRRQPSNPTSPGHHYTGFAGPQRPRDSYDDNGNVSNGYRRLESYSGVPRYEDDDDGDDDVFAVVDDHPSGFYTDVIGKVLYNLHTLDPMTWAKIIYMERGRQVAKAYAEDRAVIVDGSYAEYDGQRLGLGACANKYRDEETHFFHSSIVEGVRLKHDTDGSISACRLCDQPIIIKGLHDVERCLSEDALVHRGQLPYEQTIKIFDMNEFRSKVALELKKPHFTKDNLWRLCVIALAFGRDEADDLRTPCWLCIVNVKAVTSLKSGELIREAQHRTATLEIRAPEVSLEKLRADEAKQRRERGRWARTDQRQHLEEKEQGPRYVRQQLRLQKKEVGSNVGYSWQNNQAEKKTTMESLQQWIEPGRKSRRSRGSGEPRDWAKVETAVRDQRNKSALEKSVSDLPEPDY